ncbi:MAG TPA: hypothetical protein VGT06_03940 [Candidatus Methylomirabilis sp.]|nr:hypothetical protein [Candidatus Methylomirabilis sp.]
MPDVNHPTPASRRGRLLRGGWGLIIALLPISVLAIRPADAGHELSYYPAFYPQEIRIEAMDPAAAGALLQKNSLHAYIGDDPFGRGGIPANVSHAESFGSFVVLTFNPASESARPRASRCAISRKILQALAGAHGEFVLHPYPVTPYHPDYLHHFDLAEAANRESRGAPSPDQRTVPPAVRVRAKGKLAKALVGSRWRAEGEGWDATLEEVDLDALLAPHRVSLSGWLGPPWLKEGWFHAYLLMGERVTDPTQRAEVEAAYRRLIHGTTDSAEERLTLERTLAGLLTRGCKRVTIGYTLKRTYFNSDFSAGVENIAQDSHAGFLSPMFPRTVKLKDFPWNGWLRVGVALEPQAAWNPVAGFTDPAGRMVWSTVGDPAAFPTPYAGRWIPNRVTVVSVDAASDRTKIPGDALLPEPGTGRLRKVGDGKTASAAIRYRVVLSPFHDGTRMGLADVLYPLIFAYRWSVRDSQDPLAYDPSVAAATALLRERLAGIRVVRTEREVKEFGEIKVMREILIIDVYLGSTSPSLEHETMIIPPWSTLPWHLLALMEEAVIRGMATFSQEEAKRRGVEWLDLVRGKGLLPHLASLLEELERRAYTPDALKEFAGESEAQQRWTALKRFYQAHGHFLLTNGPYRLAAWSGDAAVLQVVRDLSYPLGVGAFDRYALPPRAFISNVEERQGGLQVSAEIEKAVRAQRTYTLVREALTSGSDARGYPVESILRFIALGPDGTVRHAGTAPLSSEGTFAVSVTGWMPGPYTILMAVYTNENALTPAVKTVSYLVKG